MLLRPHGSGKYQVVGPCYIHGLADSEALLGPLVDPWTAQIKPGTGGISTPCYFDKAAEVVTLEDPRLGPVPDGWELLDRHRTPDDPVVLTHFRNKFTGEHINSDPRLFSEVLRARGVHLEIVQLV